MHHHHHNHRIKIVPF